MIVELISLPAIYFSAAHAALLPPRNSASCMAALVAVRENSDLGGMTEARRHFALLNDRWGSGLATVEDKTLPITFERLELDSRNLKEPSETTERLGQQLNSLDRSIREQELPENERTFSFMTGASLVGTESINAYLSRQKQLAEYFGTVRIPQNDIVKLMYIMDLLWASIVGPFALSNTLNVVGSAGLSVLQGYPHPAFFFSVIGGAFTVESASRLYFDRDWFLTSRTKEWQTTSAEPSSSRRWIYRSISHRMPRGFSNGAKYSLDPEWLKIDLRTQDSSTDFARWVRKNLLRMKDKDSWIFVDELLSRDPQSQEPVLSVIVRVSDDAKRPLAPKRKKEAKEAQRKLVEDGT